MPERWGGLGRAFAVLLAASGLGACVAQPGAAGYRASPTATALPALAGQRVAVLLPLSGANAPLGQSMLMAVKLAWEPGSGVEGLETMDTKGTPEGAAAAARAAAAAGAGLIVGPLTAPETAAVGPVAADSRMDVLSLTSDSRAARPGLWTMGLTPAQQVRTLVRASAADGRRRIGAILPANPFGESLADGLRAAAADAALPPPAIVRYQPGAGLTEAVAQLGGGQPAAQPPVDALLLGTTADVTLRLLPSLAAAGLGPDRVRLLGTALWARDLPKLAPLAGAWFAAPSSATLKVFEDNYIAHYGAPPRELASVAFDAAGAARAASSPAGIQVATLLNPTGFAGANGVFRLLPDGRVRRSLALYQIGPNGAEPRDAPSEDASPAM